MLLQRLYRVRGRVQGVAFRAATRAEALALGVGGYARNLADGSVEVCAIGTPDRLIQLESWLWRGPPAARVDSVEVEGNDQPGQDDGSGFRIR